MAVALALIGLAAWLLAPLILPALLKQNLPFGGRIVRAFFEAAPVVGVCGAVLAALTPVLLFLMWLAPRFDRYYEHFAGAYERALTLCLRHRLIVGVVLLAAMVPAVWAARQLGQELFPDVDSGEFTVHMRASGGPRVEETERQIAEIEQIVGGFQGTCRELVNKLIDARRARDLEFMRKWSEPTPICPRASSSAPWKSRITRRRWTS